VSEKGAPGRIFVPKREEIIGWRIVVCIVMIDICSIASKFLSDHVPNTWKVLYFT
jgi:hypothetical protein